MVRACSGIVIRYESRITTLLSSASLVRCSHDDSKIDNDLKVGPANHTAHFDLLI
jgi:hypothetical protein